MRYLLSLRLVVVALLAASVWTSAGAASASDPNWVRTSQYVTVRDGTRLALDLYRPAVNGTPLAQPLPVILNATIDTRVWRRPDGTLVPAAPFLLDILKQGYVIAALETRGQGASFGRQTPERLETATDYTDLYDVIEWLAAQPWSTGRIGMAGCSNRGVIQLRAASAMPPHLKAIAPTAAPLDWATMGTINGVPTRFFGAAQHPVFDSTPVDADPDGVLARTAVLEHGSTGKDDFNRPFRDAPLQLTGVNVLPTYWWNLLPSFSLSHIAVFQYAGWRDFFPEQAFALYRSLARQGIPQKLIIGPWYHCQWEHNDLTDAAGETARWYDYWLKGIANGVMQEPPIRYYVVGAPSGKQWKTADHWPLPQTRRETYFLTDHGGLHSHTPSAPPDQSRPDEYVVDYTVSTAELRTRWSLEAILAASNDPASTGRVGLAPIPTAQIDAHSLTYTTPPLRQDAELTGFPSVTLWIASTAQDQDVFVYLEEVDANGRSTLLTDGAMRASDRALRTPPFDNAGLPWHADLKSDQAPLPPGAPTKLEWALFPFSNYIPKGHRLRLSINSFDQAGWISPQISPAPTVRIYHDAQHPSSLTLPFIK